MTGTPFIPERITVHLGPPDSNAENVSVTFPDYVKNVASSEIFPNWPENSLRANIYVISTFALNRIYTEWYRAKGYDFDITNSTQYDQKFINGREIFENISQLTDELFSNYVRRQGYVEPLFTQFCNGTTVTCEGLSQWGTVDLAKQGMTPYEILQYYYGDNIEIVRDAQVMTNTPSYPGIELRLGSFGNDVRTIQVQLNRIARNYPAIQKISSVDGAFGVQTEDAVKTFQQIFNMPQTGVVDKATWYKIAYIFTSVKKLAELNSEGLRLEEVDKQFKEDLSPGMQNNEVKILQYFLAVIGAYYDSIMPVDITGYYYEPWHYRYVGIPHAIYMKQNNLCLEEYLDKIKNNKKENPLTVSAEDGTTWSMWYEKAYEDGNVTQIAIPKDCDYEISGNNVDGFIITVKSK